MSFTGFTRHGEVVVLTRPLWSVIVHMTITAVVAGAFSFPPIGSLFVLIAGALRRGAPPDPWHIHFALFATALLTAAGLHALTLRWRIDLDFERRTIRARGLVWYGPWWRPRFTELTASIDALRALELVPRPVHPFSGPRRVRLVFDEGSLTVPGSFEHRERLLGALSPIVPPTRPLPMEFQRIPILGVVIIAVLVCLAGAAMVWYAQSP